MDETTCSSVHISIINSLVHPVGALVTVILSNFTQRIFVPYQISCILHIFLISNPCSESSSSYVSIVGVLCLRAKIYLFTRKCVNGSFLMNFWFFIKTFSEIYNLFKTRCNDIGNITLLFNHYNELMLFIRVHFIAASLCKKVFELLVFGCAKDWWRVDFIIQHRCYYR